MRILPNSDGCTENGPSTSQLRLPPISVPKRMGRKSTTTQQIPVMYG